VTTILVVDDEPQIRRALRTSLEAHGYVVHTAGTGEEALVAAAEASPDLIFLDLGLPDLDGTEVIRRVRSFSEVPVIVLSVRDRQADKVSALDAGADDYVAKPFRVAELVARLRARLRVTPAPEPADADQVTAGDVRVDGAAHRAFVGETELDLTPKEFDLLQLLVSEAGRTVERTRIMRAVWDEHWWGPTRTLDMHVSALRRKLGDDPANSRRIVIVRGVGFRLESV